MSIHADEIISQTLATDPVKYAAGGAKAGYG